MSGFWDGVVDWGVPIVSGLARRTPLGMGIAAGIAAGGSLYKNAQDGLDWSDVGAIGLDVGGSVVGSALGPLAGKGMKNGLRSIYQSAPSGVSTKDKLAATGKAFVGKDAKDNITKKGMVYAGAGSGLGFNARELFGGLPGSGSGNHVPIPTRPAGEVSA